MVLVIEIFGLEIGHDRYELRRIKPKLILIDSCLPSMTQRPHIEILQKRHATHKIGNEIEFGIIVKDELNASDEWVIVDGEGRGETRHVFLMPDFEDVVLPISNH